MALDRWADGNDYDRYMARWSRLVAMEFVPWLGVAPGGTWLDVGCGTGVLSATVLDSAAPAAVVGVDPSEGFLAHARERLGTAARFEVGDAQSLRFPDASFDAVVSGLVLNFVPDADAAAAEFRRVVRPGGTAGAYVWDYAGGMQMMARFWDVAVVVDGNLTADHEAARFASWNTDRLGALLESAGFGSVETREIVVDTPFADFDDYWEPFLGATGVAPAYLRSLESELQAEIRDRLRDALPTAADGSIPLTARAWAAKGVAPE